MAVNNKEYHHTENAYYKACDIVEDRFKGIFDSTPDAISFCNLDGLFIDVNDSFCHLTGYSKRELLGKINYKDITPPEYSKMEARIVSGIRRTGNARKYEKEYFRKDGIRVPISITAWAFRGMDRSLLGFAAIIKDMTEYNTLRSYISETIRVQEEERKRLARELHDETAQAILALSLDIQALLSNESRAPRRTRPAIEMIWHNTMNILEGLRRCIHELRPDVLDRLGLIPALEGLTSEMGQDGFDCNFEVIGIRRRLKAETELTLYRVVQEALNNIKRHSQAQLILVRVRFTHSEVKLTIRDNGGGFQLPEMLGDFALERKLGLLSMQERIRLLKGKLVVKSQVGKGTIISISVPSSDLPSEN